MGPQLDFARLGFGACCAGQPGGRFQRLGHRGQSMGPLSGPGFAGSLCTGSAADPHRHLAVLALAMAGNGLHGDACRRRCRPGCWAVLPACSGHPWPDPIGRHARRPERAHQSAARLRARQRRGTEAVEWLAVIGLASGASSQLASVGSSRQAATLERKVAVPAFFEQLSSDADAASPGELPDLGPAPSVAGATQWLNGPALDLVDLRDKVVLVDFWIYDCINCRNSLPYIIQWARRYAEQGLVVVGVHTLEYAFERIVDNCDRPSGGWKFSIPWQSTTSTAYGRPSTITTGRRITLSMPTAAFVICMWEGVREAGRRYPATSAGAQNRAVTSKATDLSRSVKSALRLHKEP